MHEPKIIKFKGGYSADAELVFCSWHADVLSYIEDHELDNEAVIQLIIDQTQESACQEVKFQLDLCGGGEHPVLGFVKTPQHCLPRVQ